MVLLVLVRWTNREGTVVHMLATTVGGSLDRFPVLRLAGYGVQGETGLWMWVVQNVQSKEPEYS